MMNRSNAPLIRDAQASAVIVSKWTLDSSEDQTAAAEAALSALSAAPGLLRFSVFRGLEDLTLLPFSQWVDVSSRDHYVETAAHEPHDAVDAKVRGIERNWRDMGIPYRSFVADPAATMGCLILVRQPLVRPDEGVQRAWVDSVIAALGSDEHPPAGLCAATFFLSADGGHVINLAE